MTKQIRVISDDDWNVLKRIVSLNQNLQQTPLQRPSSMGQFLDGDDSMAPEVYIALPPFGGIPGLTSVAAGTSSDNPPTEGDRPGSALCTICKIVDGALIEVTGLSRTVYNISEADITQDWIVIERDKFGNWVPVSFTASTSVNIKRGKLATTLSSGSRISPTTGTIEVWEFDGTDWSETNPLQQLIVYDDGMIGDGNSPLALGTWIQIVKIGSYWFYDGHNCDPSTGTAS